MAGNTLGSVFRLTTYGESHGQAIGGVIDGCPAGVDIDIAAIQRDLDRRRPGQSKYTTQRNESDTVHLLSGVFEGKTTGTPIGIHIANTNQKPKDYQAIANLYRPGHADFTYQKKYGIRDYRGGGRSSARETAIRVAAGAVGKQVLKHANIRIHSYLSALGDIITAQPGDANFDLQATQNNPFFSPNAEIVPTLQNKIDALRKQGDSTGAELGLLIDGVPAGLGEPVFDRLDADLAKALMSINAVKAVAIGDGFAVVRQRGSEHRDELTSNGFASNHAGGILGGISTGQQILATIAFKPTSSITIPGRTIDTENKETNIVTKGRHDPCVGIRAVAIVEAMAALVITDHWLRNRSSRIA